MVRFRAIWIHVGGDELAKSMSDVELRSLAREGARVRLEALRQEIAALEALVAGERTGRGGRRAAAAGRTRRRGQLSAAGRAAIVAAQKARWAQIKSAKSGASAESSASAPAASARRKRSPMSAAARKAVGERMRKYWAARRRAGAKK